MNLKNKLAGRFIVLDGPDGSGKSTQISLLAKRLAAEGLDVLATFDPGGTAIGERIRKILLGGDLPNMDVRCETFLFMASRGQLVGEVIEPAIQGGKVVVCDRFISATCAYQGAAGYDVPRIIELGRYAVGGTWPQLTVILDVPAELGLQRIRRRPGGRRQKQSEPDAMESRPLEYHQKVRHLFLRLPGLYPGRVEVVDGTSSPEQVHQSIMEILTRVDF